MPPLSTAAWPPTWRGGPASRSRSSNRFRGPSASGCSTGARRISESSAVDAIVLEAELSRSPALAACLRVIETFGPSPIPPLVASTGLDGAIRERLREALLGMSDDTGGDAALRTGRVQRFTAVTDT